MTSIPLPWLVSVLALLVALLALSQPRMPMVARVFFGLALGAVAGVMAILGLRIGGGLALLGRVQPHIALLIAPAFWLGFQALATQELWPAERRLHLALGAVLVAELVLLLPLPWSADIAVVLVNAGFAALLAMMFRLKADAFCHVAPKDVRPLRIALAGALSFVVFVSVADVIILLAAFSGGDARAMRLLAGISGVGVAFVVFGVIVGIPLVLAAARPFEHDGGLRAVAQPADHEMLARVDALMRESLIFRDPGLTLARLGRRLGCPARAISTAVNIVTGENLSRYINGFRVRHAADLLDGTDMPVTEVMLEAGFVSKSSFNSEFRRILGTTPSDYRRSRDVRQV